MSVRAIASIAPILLGLLVTAAIAQQFAQTAASTVIRRDGRSWICSRWTSGRSVTWPMSAPQDVRRRPHTTRSMLVGRAQSSSVYLS